MTAFMRRARALAIVFLALAPLIVGLLPRPSRGEQPAAPKTQKEKVSYIIGNDFGNQIGASLQRLRNDGFDIDMEKFLQGMKDSLSSAQPALTMEEMQAVMKEFGKEMKAKVEARQANAKANGEKNRKDGDAFLAKNKKQPGVTTTASGLQYKVIKQGSGPVPTLSDTVTVQYRGTLLDGTEFDSSAKHGHPLSIGVSSVIPGWTEVLQLMKVGSKVTVYIPGNLGYGERGGGPGSVIGPNALLIFEIELLDTKSE